MKSTDDSALFSTLVSDAKRADSPLIRNNYWMTYRVRIRGELEKNGLVNLRQNHKLLKGFVVSGMPQPTPPSIAWKRGVWRAIETFPGLNEGGCRISSTQSCDP